MKINNKIILITGSTDGIGKETAMQLADKDNTIIIHGKNQEKGLSVVKEIQQKTGNNQIFFYDMDLSKQENIISFTKKIMNNFNKLDILINNAGVLYKEFCLTEDGLELNFAVNHYGHFILTLALLNLLQKSKNARIINTSSIAHENVSINFGDIFKKEKFNPYKAYSISKLCNILFTYKLAEKLSKTAITINCYHPGIVNTKLLSIGWQGMKGDSIANGAQCALFLATDTQLNSVTGKYFEKNYEIKSSKISYNKKLQDKLWDFNLHYADILKKESNFENWFNN